jgi:pentatricopeptide repeat protein
LQGERRGRLESTTGKMADTKTTLPAVDKPTNEAGGDTSFMPQPPAEQQAVESQEMPTGFLSEETHLQSGESNAATPGAVERSGTLQPFNTEDMASLKSIVTTEALEQAPTNRAETTQQEPTVFKARVASGAWGDVPVAPVTNVTEPQPTTTSEAENAPEQPANDSASEYGVGVRKAARTKVLNPEVAAQMGSAQALAQAEENYAPKMPTPGDITTSGPLPSLDGFEDLSAWIERYPQDMGAHMALASAYTQAGDIDTALRVYRRMLRKPNVSENVLRMVQDELGDLEDQAQQYPRYYQVRGDLLVRQGHRREAIEEYNKLG